jgi:MFS family permease
LPTTVSLEEATGRTTLRGPLAHRYWASAAMVVFALVPYLALSAAIGPITPIIARQLHMSLQTMSLASGMGNAGYAVGTVLAVQFAMHLPQRRMMLIYTVLLVLGCVLSASAQDAGMFITGHVLQGLSTSLLLIAAVPPLALGFGAAKLRETAVIMSMCIFGAVTAGPVIGGLQASSGGWRPLFWIIAGIAVAALLLALLTYEYQPPADQTAPWDFAATGLAAIGSVAAFWGASELLTHRLLGPWTIVPLFFGLAVIVFLIVHQYQVRRPLLIIRPMLQSTIPVAGIVIALFAAATSVSATSLTATLQMNLYSPVHLGLLYLPELAGAIVTAVLLGLVITRWEMQLLPLAGMLCLAAGIGILRIELPPSQPLTLIGSAVTGVGLGATVAPALFAAGFSLPSTNLQRVFAIVELMRAIAAFMIAPVFAYLAATVSGNLRSGTGIALWIGLGLALLGAALSTAIYLLGGARPEKPDIDGFINGDSPAWHSPPLLARLR